MAALEPKYGNTYRELGAHKRVFFFPNEGQRRFLVLSTKIDPNGRLLALGCTSVWSHHKGS